MRHAAKLCRMGILEQVLQDLRATRVLMEENRVGMTAMSYLSALRAAVAKLPELKVELRGRLHYDKPYDFVRIVSKDIKKSDSIILIRSGTHGEEISGPLTVLHRLKEIHGAAVKHGLKLIIYPLANPSGFENGTRWNKFQRYKGGDDFVRYANDDYKVPQAHESPGAPPGTAWKRTLEADPKTELSKETAILTKEAARLPWKQIVAILDLHQDYWVPKSKDRPAAYFYVSGKREQYLRLSRAVRRILPLYTDGNGTGQTEPADRDGFIVSNDGSFVDLARHEGVKHCVVVETTGKTPLNTAELVNMIWINGIMKLVTRK